jgi:hypothetical protein
VYIGAEVARVVAVIADFGADACDHGQSGTSADLSAGRNASCASLVLPRLHRCGA